MANPAAVGPIIVARSVACRLLSLSARQFSRFQESGLFVAVEPGRGQRGARFDATQLITAYFTHRTAAGNSEAPRDRRDRSQAELNELRLARERRLLLPRDQVVEEGQRYISAAEARLRAIVPRLRQEVAVDESISGRMEALIEEAIEEMAGWRTLTDLRQAMEDV